MQTGRRRALVNITDQVGAVGGTLTIASSPGGGTRVSGSVDLTTN